MPDREKVIKGLHDIGDFIADCVGFEQAKNFLHTIDDAVALLKEQDEQIKLLEHQTVDNKGKFNAHETLIGKALDAGHIYR